MQDMFLSFCLQTLRYEGSAGYGTCKNKDVFNGLQLLEENLQFLSEVEN